MPDPAKPAGAEYPRQVRRRLADLACQANDTVSTTVIRSTSWSCEPPRSPAHTVRHRERYPGGAYELVPSKTEESVVQVQPVSNHMPTPKRDANGLFRSCCRPAHTVCERYYRANITKTTEAILAVSLSKSEYFILIYSQTHMPSADDLGRENRSGTFCSKLVPSSHPV